MKYDKRNFDYMPYKGNKNLNRSDYFYLIGTQLSGLIAGMLNLDPEKSYWEVLGYALMGTAMGAAMLLFLLVMIGQPPSLYSRWDQK